MEIRNVTEKDLEYVVKICLGDSPLNDNPAWKDAILTCFCNYYVNEEPQNCFVAVDDNNRVLGYVLCAEDYNKWKKVFIEKYVRPTSNPIVEQMAQGTINCLLPFSDTHPAHLHINMSADAQGKGIGTQLLNMLKNHLKNKGVICLALDVAADNEGAIRFYKRNGFQILLSSEREYIMGITI